MKWRQIVTTDFEESLNVQGFNNGIEEVPSSFDTKDKIHTLKHNNREIKVKVPYYLSDLEPVITAEPKSHNVLFMIGKKVYYSLPCFFPFLLSVLGHLHSESVIYERYKGTSPTFSSLT